MKTEKPIEEFTLIVHEDGAVYQKCKNCGAESKVNAIYNGPEIIYCPKCGTKYE